MDTQWFMTHEWIFNHSIFDSPARRINQVQKILQMVQKINLIQIEQKMF